MKEDCEYGDMILRDLSKTLQLCFISFLNLLNKLAFGVSHGLAVDYSYQLYGWGDGTYGELGDFDIFNFDKPTIIKHFYQKDIKVINIKAGQRHSVVLDDKGCIYTFGDNSRLQWTSDRFRRKTPYKIESDFKATSIFSGDHHNICRSDQGYLYSWGGEVLKFNTNRYLTDIKLMVDYAGSQVKNVWCSHNNSVS